MRVFVVYTSVRITCTVAKHFGGTYCSITKLIAERRYRCRRYPIYFFFNHSSFHFAQLKEYLRVLFEVFTRH